MTQVQTDVCEATTATETVADRQQSDRRQACAGASLNTTQPQNDEGSASQQAPNAMLLDPIAIVLRKYSHSHSNGSGGAGGADSLPGGGHSKDGFEPPFTSAPQLLTAGVQHEAPASTALPLTVLQPVNFQAMGCSDAAAVLPPAPAASDIAADAMPAQHASSQAPLPSQAPVLHTPSAAAVSAQPSAQRSVPASQVPVPASRTSIIPVLMAPSPDPATPAERPASAAPAEEPDKEEHAPRLLTCESVDAPRHTEARPASVQQDKQIPAKQQRGDSPAADDLGRAAEERAPLLVTQLSGDESKASLRQPSQQQQAPSPQLYPGMGSPTPATRETSPPGHAQIVMLPSSLPPVGAVMRLANEFLEGNEMAALQYATCLAPFAGSAMEQVQRLTQLDQQVQQQFPRPSSPLNGNWERIAAFSSLTASPKAYTCHKVIFMWWQQHSCLWQCVVAKVQPLVQARKNWEDLLWSRGVGANCPSLTFEGGEPAASLLGDGAASAVR